jgi:hypothetical protein
VAVTAASVRLRWSVPAVVDDTLLGLLITEASGIYLAQTGEAGLTALSAHLALSHPLGQGAAAKGRLASVSHNAASKSYDLSTFNTAQTATGSWLQESAPGRYYAALAGGSLWGWTTLNG